MVPAGVATTEQRPAGHRQAPEDVRDAIVDATIRLVGRGGTAAVTHRAVAAEAGVSLSSTTYHFASKDAIVDAALRRVAEREIARLASAAAALQDTGPQGLAAAAVDWLAHQLAEDDEVVRAGYHLQLESARRPALQPVHLAWARAVQDLAEHVLRAAGSPHPRTDARLLAAAVDGLRLEQLTTPDRPAALRPVVGRLLEALTAGPRRP
jgi:DNA-binding transcriptional regulator YbjK